MIANKHYCAAIGEQGQFYAMFMANERVLENGFISSEEPVQVSVESIMEAWACGFKSEAFILKSKTVKYYTFDCFSGELIMYIDATTVELAGVSNGHMYVYDDGVLHIDDYGIRLEVCPRYICYSNGVWLFNCGDELKFYYDGVLKDVGKNFPIKPFKDCCLTYDKSLVRRNKKLFSVLYEDGDLWFSEHGTKRLNEKIVGICKISDSTQYNVSETGDMYQNITGFTRFYYLNCRITKVLKLSRDNIIYVTGCDIVKTDFESETNSIICSFDHPIMSVVYGDVIFAHLVDGSVYRVKSGTVTKIPFFDSHPIAMPSKASVKNARKVC